MILRDFRVILLDVILRGPSEIMCELKKREEELMRENEKLRRQGKKPVGGSQKNQQTHAAASQGFNPRGIAHFNSLLNQI